MTMFEVVLRLSYGGGNCELTQRFPSLKIFGWCNKQHDVVELVVKDPEEYALFVEQTPKPEAVMEESSDHRTFHLITKTCSCLKEKMSFVRLIGNLAVLRISPMMAEKGWEYHRVVIFKHEDLKELMRRLEEEGFIVEILRKVPLDGFIESSLTLSADTLFSELTQRQIDALLTAHRYGYYKLPRKADVQAIAAKKHVPRTTLSDNLKKAENKLISALVPYIQLFNKVPEEKRLSLKVK